MTIDLPRPRSVPHTVIGRLAEAAERLDPITAHMDDLDEAVETLLDSPEFEQALIEVTHARSDDENITDSLRALDAIAQLGELRRLRSVLTMPTATALGSMGRVLGGLAPDADGPSAVTALARRLNGTATGSRRLAEALGPRSWVDALAGTDPHAVAATSPYRRSGGSVVSSADDRVVEAVMTQETFTSLRVIDGVLDPAQPLLAELYEPLGRCVAFVDSNVMDHHGDALIGYFDHHGIALQLLVHRAMEIDKGIRTVETMLGELKAHGVSRDEPVLVVGGGVLADTAGLACSLYHRSTPYVMVSTSLVAGIDAGPSPRTCCDGFGYKNLLGAYHPPIISITDRSFFSSLRAGWLRHGLAEVAKMAIVDDADLFALLEEVGPDLVTTRFGTVAVEGIADVGPAADRVIGAALRSYVGVEYDNLYETHQLRPHAYGHTWSPGFEIAAGLLHGHAVSIGMGFGAFLSNRAGLLRRRGHAPGPVVADPPRAVDLARRPRRPRPGLVGPGTHGRKARRPAVRSGTERPHRLGRLSRRSDPARARPRARGLSPARNGRRARRHRHRAAVQRRRPPRSLGRRSRRAGTRTGAAGRTRCRHRGRTQRGLIP